MSSLVRGMDRVLDAGVLAFACWTACAHLAVALGWGLDRLLLVAAVLGAVLGTMAWLGAFSRRRSPTPELAVPEVPPVVARTRPPWNPRLAVGLLAAAAAAAAMWGAEVSIIWGLAALAATIALVHEFRSDATTDARLELEARDASRHGPTVLVALTLLCVAIALLAHRPDADDAFYLNLAVSAADAPGAALLAGDSLHRIEGAPLPLPVYRVHSLELLIAAVARVTGAPVLDVAHLGLPVLAALLLPWVFGRLMRRLTPNAWPWATAAAIAFLLFSAAASHGWSSFGLVRLHQGKGILLSLLLPAVTVYAIGFARTGGLRAWLLLAAAEIAALGVSASALWLAPAVGATALLAGLDSLRSAASAKRFLLGIAASGYVIARGLTLRAETATAFRDAVVQSPEMALSAPQLAAQALHVVLGPGAVGAVVLFIAFGAWSVASTRLARRLCACFGAAVLVLWNPLFADWIAAHLTSAATYWRVLWLLPLPAMVAVALVSPLSAGTSAHGRGAAYPVVAAGTVAIVLFSVLLSASPKSFVLSPSNAVRLGLPGWKVPRSEFDAAAAIARAAEPAQLVLAARRVAPWIVTIRNHPTALVVRSEYLPVLHDVLGRPELERRMHLMRLVSGREAGPKILAMLRSAIIDDGLVVVCLERRALRSPELPGLLRQTGFQPIYENADYQVWKRNAPTAGDSP